MEQDKWTTTRDGLPPQQTVVDTKCADIMGSRNECQLKMKGNLWFLPDMSMYVYYTPTHWKLPSPPQPIK